MQKVPISVVIPTYNRNTVLIQTIESLLSGLQIPDEIIVVDQTTPQIQLPEALRNNEIITFIHMEEPSSTKSRNIGMSHARNDILLFCDDDIIVNQDTIGELFSEIKKENVSMVAALDIRQNPRFTKQPKNYLKDFVGTLLGMKKFWRHDGYVIKSNMRGRFAPDITEKEPTEWAMGFFFCIKKNLASQWKIHFDEKLKRYAYAEDLDFSYRYCKRAKEVGMSAIIDPYIYVDHLASAEWRIPTQEAALYLIVNRRYLLHKIFPKNKVYPVAMQAYDSLYTISQFGNRQYNKQLRHAMKIAKAHSKEIMYGELAHLVKLL